jgi:hypothetical protein
MNRRKGSQFSKSLSERNNFLNPSNLKFSQCQNLGTTTGAYGLWYGRREKKAGSKDTATNHATFHPTK